MNHYNAQRDRFEVAPNLALMPMNGMQKYWVLSTSMDYRGHGDSITYELRIKRAFNGETWDHFSFFRCDYRLGDPVEKISHDEYMSRLVAVEDNEGGNAANTWTSEFTKDDHVMRGYESLLKAALIRRWEALSELVSPMITM